MRIIGFSKDWPKLHQDISINFTTFRFVRRDRDWEIGELAQAILKPRSPNRKHLGIVQISNSEPRRSSFWLPPRGPFFFPLPARVTEEEAIADGFVSLAKMEAWLIKANGRECVESEIINKLTLQWTQREEFTK